MKHLRVLKITEKQRGVMGARSWGKGRMASNCLLALVLQDENSYGDGNWWRVQNKMNTHHHCTL